MSWFDVLKSSSRLQKIALFLFVLGWLIIGILAIFLPRYIQHVKNVTVEEGLVVASFDDDDYEDWLINTDDDDIPEHYLYTFFHIENAEELVNEEPPPERWQVSAKGPYAFREYCQKHNVSFEEDGKYAKYTEHCWYIFDDKRTKEETGVQLDPINDEITAINPMYLTIVTLLGGEERLDDLLDLICYQIPNFEPQNPSLKCNNFGAPTSTGGVLTMDMVFGKIIPDTPPSGGLLKTSFTNSFKFSRGSGGGAGLIVTRTPEQWLFFQTPNPQNPAQKVPFFDPLLYLLHFTPDATLDYLEEMFDITVPRPLIFTPLFGYGSNTTQSQFFGSHPQFDMRYTGKDDLDNLWKWKMWSGNEVIYRVGDPRGPNHLSGSVTFPGWGMEVPVDGIHAASRFKPDPSKDDMFICWLDQAIRPMHFSYDEKTKTSIGDIEVTRYLSRPEDFYNVRYNPTNAVFYHWDNIPNYLAPYAPISGVLLYAGKPYFWNSTLFSFEAFDNPTNALDFLTGVPSDPLEFETYAMIEPLFGLSLEGKQQIQFSTFISHDLYNLSAPFLPEAWIPTLIQNYQVDLDQNSADDYNDSADAYHAADKASELCLILGCFFGILFIVISGILCFVDRKQRQHIEGYTAPTLKSTQMTELPPESELNLLYTT